MLAQQVCTRYLLKPQYIRVMAITPCCPSFLLDETQPKLRTDRKPPKAVPGALPKAAMASNTNITPCAPTFITEPKLKRKRSQAPETIPKAKAKVQARPFPPSTYPAHAIPVPKQGSTPRQIQNPAQGHAVPDPDQWWISKSLELPDDRRNGWVLAWIIETHFKEHVVVEACGKTSYVDRMREAGLGELLVDTTKPRKRCAVIAQATAHKLALLAEQGQRRKIDSIGGSWTSYASGLKCYAAFCDGMRYVPHFPATEAMMINFAAIFTSADTLAQYVKHVKWAHRFLNLDDRGWYTGALQQVMRGMKKTAAKPPNRPALTGKQVKTMVQEAVKNGDTEVAAMLAISRHFMLRVPSEAVPMEWDGTHSRVEISDKGCSITLSKRKNRRFPSTLKRTCCCKESGKWLCSIHWLLKLQSLGTSTTRVFTIDKAYFARRVKELAEHAGVPGASTCGTHSLRRGMAQDILDMGGLAASLA